MKLLNRFLHIITLLLTMNLPILWQALSLNRAWKLLLCLVIITLFLAGEILPCLEKGMKARIQILAGGYELIISSVWSLAIEMTYYLLLLRRTPDNSFTSLIINGICAYLILLLHYLNGFWRTAFCSAQLGITLRILMFFFWWVPPINLILFLKWCRIVRRELLTAKNKYLLEITRRENAICRTKYPVVMVHGIFFRDWQYLNYWGRIPAVLKKNGAIVYYGRQESSRSVADSAQELKAEIQRILLETGAEKVNIIAHSKGGLDTRYAISVLGLAPCVASLTTINTPHRGCRFADVLLQRLPPWLVNFVAGRYNRIFKALGDKEPDFLGGIHDLTASSCARFNETVKDAPDVYYQSAMSRLASFTSTGFPLNLSYLLVKKYDGENDGLVGVDSAPWGNYLGLISSGKKGISHGDMIDLTHKDIRQFDVGEFYVNIFSNLREKGF
ncbi:MAG: triacylglycerol lipase [Roseburia sp.]|nr:triacylglycerol lipase [Roseburia sp.]